MVIYEVYDTLDYIPRTVGLFSTPELAHMWIDTHDEWDRQTLYVRATRLDELMDEDHTNDSL